VDIWTRRDKKVDYFPQSLTIFARIPIEHSQVEIQKSQFGQLATINETTRELQTTELKQDN